MRESKPWLRKGRGWYVQINRKQHFLGKDRGDAMRAFYCLMANGTTPVQAVGELIDAFLDWVKMYRQPHTHRFYKDSLTRFKGYYPQLGVEQFRPYHVQEWIDSYEVSNGTKRNHARAIMRAMNWAEQQGYIDRSPIAHFRKPKGGIRETVISDAEYKAILQHAGQLKDIVRFAWLTGARCSEIRQIKAQHVQGNRIVMPRSQEKMKRAPRIIYLNAEAQAIVNRLCHEGHLFRNEDGQPWTSDAINCAFSRIQKKVGKKYCITDFRHTFCHRLLKAGTDALTVATLMGHSGTSMVTTVYSHLNHAPDHMAAAVEKAAG